MLQGSVAGAFQDGSGVGEPPPERVGVKLDHIVETLGQHQVDIGQLRPEYCEVTHVGSIVGGVDLGRDRNEMALRFVWYRPPPRHHLL